MREEGVPLSSSSAGNEHCSEAHRVLQESRSVDRVWNFALEELGRMNINFNPAWMSGKKQNLQNSQWISITPCLHSKITRLWLTVRICVPEYNKVYFDPLQLKRQESSRNFLLIMWLLKDFRRTLIFRLHVCPLWLPCVSNIFSHERARILQVLHRANCACRVWLHHGRNWTPMGCYLRHRIPNNFVFSCW